MQKVPQSRKVLYLLLLGLIPFFVVYYSYAMAQDRYNRTQEDLQSAIVQTTSQNQKELYNDTVRRAFKDKDHFFLTKQLEPLPLLAHEMTSIKKALSAGFTPDKEWFERRLLFLTNGQNALSFHEGEENRYTTFKETEVSLAHVVEVDMHDLSKILSHLEGVQIGQEMPLDSRPQCIISDFRIDRRHAQPSQGMLQDVYLLNFKVIRREFP